MPDIRRFDKSKREHFRSDDELKRIHENLPWNKRAPIQWGLAAAALVVAAVATQMGIWEYQRREARQQIFASLPADVSFAGCNELRARGLAPLRRGEPGYGEHMDGDGDGVACEPHPGNFDDPNRAGSIDF